MRELEVISPQVLYGLEGWEKNLCGLPDIDDGMVKRYLFKHCTVDESSLRTYKLTRPYQLKSSVHSLQFNEMKSLSACVIRALCDPSQSTDKDDVKMVHVILDKSSGEPYGGYCTCTVGFVIHGLCTQVVHCLVETFCNLNIFTYSFANH